jgi:hypothetical protein
MRMYKQQASNNKSIVRSKLALKLAEIDMFKSLEKLARNTKERITSDSSSVVSQEKIARNNQERI